MKVVILNTADAHGGAAIASWRLLHALVEEGVDARMLVVDRSTADPLVDVAGTAEQRRWAFLRERIGIFAANGLTAATCLRCRRRAMVSMYCRIRGCVQPMWCVSIG